MGRVLEVDNIDVYYGELQALWGVSLHIDEGEFISLVGSNGAGKTTTLRTISGLLTPRRGKIIFAGKDVTGWPPHRIAQEGLAHIPEGRQLFPRLTVLENLKMGAYTPRARERFDETLEFVFTLFPRLKERRDQIAGTMSGGERQMLAIARGLMLRPKLLMLDEPSPPKLVQRVMDTLRRLHEEGLTILLVEQNVRYALELADRGYVLETGRVVMEGGGKELLEDPRIKKAYLGL
ncbi:ABC transporter ATP-binding protein [Candidatus Bathyarchaeota archaeon]|nr:MAG: ABC transporter ATP-binding protein [Candidatus Bathyarchaeota archaeon]